MVRGRLGLLLSPGQGLKERARLRVGRASDMSASGNVHARAHGRRRKGNARASSDKASGLGGLRRLLGLREGTRKKNDCSNNSCQ
eukprot:6657774-Pyramimonas_sp.AAC.1